MMMMKNKHLNKMTKKFYRIIKKEHLVPASIKGTPLYMTPELV
jgi:predicted protein tyrosine phosphatase